MLVASRLNVRVHGRFDIHLPSMRKADICEKKAGHVPLADVVESATPRKLKDMDGFVFGSHERNVLVVRGYSKMDDIRSLLGRHGMFPLFARLRLCFCIIG